MTPRPLSARELRRSIDVGSRWAWQLEDRFAALYEARIRRAYAAAAKALPRVAQHSPAAGLSAAASDWTMPDPDELGLDLRKLMDDRWETGETGIPQRGDPAKLDAIRVEAMRRVTKNGLERMGVSFDLRNPLVEGVLEQLGRKITEIDETTRADIMRTLNTSWEKGDSIPRAARALRDASSQVSVSRGRMIARTELIAAQNGGSHALAAISEEFGAPLGQPPLLKVWLTAEDEKVRDTHSEAGDTYGEGNGIPLDDAFLVGDSELQFPGDPDGSAEEVINCRCAVSFEEGEAVADTTPEDAEPVSEGLGLADVLPLIDEGVGGAAVDLPSTWGRLDDEGAAERAFDLGQAAKALLPEETRVAFNHYLGDDWSDEVLPFMRGQRSSLPAEGRKLMDTVLGMFRTPGEHAILPEDAILYRGMNLKALPTAGDVLTDRAFMSMTAEEETATVFSGGKGETVVLRVHAPAGEKYLGGHSSEGELIFPPDTRLVVVERSPVEIGDAPTFEAIMLRADQAPEDVLPPAVAGSSTVGGVMDTLEWNSRTLVATGETTPTGAPIYELELPSIVPEDAVPVGSATDRSWAAVLALEGVPTSDGRMLGIDSVTWRTLPLPLMALLTSDHGGGSGPAIVAGRIDEIEKTPVSAAITAGLLDDPEGGYPQDAVAVVARGVFDDGLGGDEVQRLVTDETLRGVSIDLAPQAVEVVELPPTEDAELGALLEVVTDGEIMGATVCPFPAFANAVIRVDAPGLAPEAPAQPVVACLRRRLPLRVLVAAGITLQRPEPARFAAIDHSASSMIAVHPTPAEADALARPGGQPAADLHVTLAYLPDADAVDFAALNDLVASVAADHEPIAGKVAGAGYFKPDEPEAEPPQGEKPDEEDEDAVVAAVDDEEPEPPPPVPEDDTEPELAAPHPHVALVDAPGLSKMRARLADALDEAGVPYSQSHDFTPHITLGYEPEPGTPAMDAAGAPVSFGAIAVHEGAARKEHPLGAGALTASAAGLAPERPPSAWFEDPELAEPTPLTITDEGRIFGHLATWGSCHVGYAEECVQPPTSLTDYALFHLGHVLTEEGDLVPVGTFTMDTGHADLRLGSSAALAHYDNTGTAVADVRVGEDETGIWFSGAIRPDLDSRKVRALRAAQISGDWRPHNGTREMVAGLAVNVPGFPVVRPRTAVAASGVLLGLVAAGIDLSPAPGEALRTRILELAERAWPGYLEARREALTARVRA